MKRPRAWALALAGLSVTAGSLAYASHNTWDLYDDFTNCVVEGHFGDPMFEISYGSGGARTMMDRHANFMCPVSLGGQFGGDRGDSIDAIVIHSTVPALDAQIHYVDNHPSDAITCWATARTENGSEYFSDARSSEDGPGSLRLATNHERWGFTLGDATKVSRVRNFMYQCSVPPSTGGLGSSILGATTRVCMNNARCFNVH